MNHCAASLHSTSHTPLVLARWRDLKTRERRLAFFGAAMFLLLLPMAIAATFDDRTLRGADLWLKPMKFALSIGVLSWTTAWFIGDLPLARRSSRAIDRIAWLVIGAGSFEWIYIVIQAALGQASHYNIGDPLHIAMYALMGIGAVVLTATQPMLAWQLYRHPDPLRPAAYRQAILIGLVLTFVFGAGVGALLAGLQPPDGGAVLPVLGWSLSGGDLRPAHFIGIHAEQVLPLLGFLIPRDFMHAKTLVWLAALGYAVLFAALVLWGLAGRL